MNQATTEKELAFEITNVEVDDYNVMICQRFY